MSSKAHKKIKAGLEDALAFLDGDDSRAVVTRVKIEVVDTKALRARLHMSQVRFAETYSIPVHSLRKWEQGKRHPDATTRAYLKVIEYDPTFAREAIVT